MLDAAAEVELRVHNLSRQDCRDLEKLLTDWVKWRKEQPQVTDAFQAQLMCGSLVLDVTRLLSDGVLTWQDTLHPAQPQPQEAEELPGEPRYERGTGELLAPAVVDNALLLPGGSAAARRRQLAQAAVGDWVDGAAYEAPADTPQAKRRRVGLNKCHNCGSYKHSVNKCPVPFDQKRVAASVAEARAERGSVGPMAQMRLRYFDMPGGTSGAGEQRRGETPTPGVLSADLADALGMASAAAPPPWLSRMVVLGVPPRYAEDNEQQVDEAAEAGDGLMVFFRGSDDEDDAGQGGAAAASDADAAANGSLGGSGSSDDDDDDDGLSFIPFADANGGPASSQEQQQQHQPGSQTAQPPPNGQQVTDAHAQQQEPVQQQAAANGAAAAASAQPPPPKWVFPGLNGQSPEGDQKEAWTQALQTAAWLSARLV